MDGDAGRGMGHGREGGWARLHSITHSMDVDYRQNTSIRQHLTMTSARVHIYIYICARVRVRNICVRAYLSVHSKWVSG